MTPLTKGERGHDEPEREIDRSRLVNDPGTDPVVQRQMGPNAMPTPIISFDGQSNPTACGTCSPPDTNGEVGPNHYIQMVNVQFQIFNKQGTSLYGPVNFNTLFQGFGGACQNDNDGDPLVLYDQLADRWILTQFALTSPNFECVAVSATGDPLGSYHRYAFQTNVFPDYPKLGVWPDAYYLTINTGNTTRCCRGRRPDRSTLKTPPTIGQASSPAISTAAPHRRLAAQTTSSATAITSSACLPT
jgi:hypothetical protein